MKAWHGIVVLLLCGLVGGAMAAEGSVPLLSHEFRGSVTIDGSPAPVGTTVVAMIDGTENVSLKTTVAGKYGGSTPLVGKHLIVTGTAGQKGHTVTFMVGGAMAEETATFIPRTVTHLDLHVLTTPRTGSIAVTSVPAGAVVSLDGKVTGTVTNNTLANVAVGTHTVTMTKVGYLPASSQVTVVRDQIAPVHFDLERETGSIAVTSVPAGAVVSLDGKVTGTVTNNTLANVAVGTHTVTMTKAGYLPASSQVTVVRDQTAPVHFDLERETGHIVVTATPPGASIFLDGADTGTVTNNTLASVPVGTHTVAVKTEGYLPASSQVTVVRDQTAPVHFDLERETGNIMVTSVPPGAAIFLDSVATGTVTNNTLKDVPVGAHTVAVKTEGYLNASSGVTVVRNQTESVHFDLVQATGNIALTSIPSGASIFLDGADTGTVTNGTLTDVPVGTHTVAVKTEGYLNASSEVTVVHDQTASVHFDLVISPAPPVAAFSAALTDGGVPFSVQFTDLSTNATAWSWSFGDGNISEEQHPAHTYTALGRYTVTLTVTNAVGTDTLVRPHFISVRDIPDVEPEDKTDYTFDDEGMNVTSTGGQQQISFNETAGNGTVSGNDILLSAGGLNVTILTEGLTVNGTVSTGNVAGVLLESNRPAAALLDGAGNVSVTFNASMNTYNPDLTITTSIYDRPSNGTSTAFALAAADKELNLTSTAYAIYFTKTNQGENDTISDAYLRMTVSPTWVKANGGPDAIRIFRRGDDGVTSVLETTYLGLDDDGMMIFVACSPDGFSAFALAATKLIKPAEHTTHSSHHSSGGSKVTPTTSTGTAHLLTASWGGVLRPYLVYVNGTFAHLYLETGVTALDSDGKPLSEVTITAASAMPSTSSLLFSGYAVNCSPDRATFSPAIDLVFTFTAEEWPALLNKAGDDPSRLVVQGYDPLTGAWEDVHTEVSAQTITAPISHFSTYALFIGPAAEEPVTTGPTATTTAATTTAATTPAPSKETGGIPVIWAALVIVVAGAFIVGSLHTRRR